jgi:alpha-tubulin suppressor-like RCC1 family protein
MAQAKQATVSARLAGKLAAHLTKTSFPAARAENVKLVFKFSSPSKSFAYRIMRQNGANWSIVVSAKQKGRFRGPHTATVGYLFASQPIALGRYRLRLSSDSSSVLLPFEVVKPKYLTNVTAVSAGDADTCAVRSSGSVVCWGLSDYGRLGDGTIGPYGHGLIPVITRGISTATAVSAGGQHTCALLSGGSVACWGYNGSGQLGYGTTAGRLVPVGVSAITSGAAVSASSGSLGHSCVRLSGGEVDCWGDNEEGQLGNGTTTGSSTPVAVSGIAGAVAVSAGLYDTCAVLADGSTDCWGSNFYGQLGNGTKAGSSTPVAVRGITNAVQVSVNAFHACALLITGAVECWGYNGSGQLGNGTKTDRSTPVAVSGITNATEISAGFNHTCALLSGGTVECWGNNSDWKLGNGTTKSSSTPVAVSGITNAIQVSAGATHSCALLSGGTVECWGNGWDGELGNGIYSWGKTPVRVIDVNP